MANIRKRGARWQVQIRRFGRPPLSKSFLAKDDAVRWSREQERLADLASEEIVATITQHLAGELDPTPQSPDGVSLTKRLTRADGLVDSTFTADDTYRAWRAYRPWPGVWVSVAPALERLILDEVGEPRRDVQVEAGHFVLHEGALMLGLQDGALPLLQVTPTGGRRMGGAELVRGRPELLAPHARISA